MTEYHLSDKAYRDFSAFLQRELGIVLGDNRQYLVRSRLSSLARKLAYEDFGLFISKVVSNVDQSLSEQCLELMTTNETFWFRDEYPFAILQNNILPDLHKRKQTLKIWSSACASGQESYSIAMCLLEYQRQHPAAFSGGAKILASDYSNEMIAKASAGNYDELALSRGLPPAMRSRYFEAASNNKMSVNSQLKSLVEFKQLNLRHSFSSLGQFDIIYCRNVLIYFDGKQKNDILKKIAACLPKHGILFLGAAESITGAEEFFAMKNLSQGLYYERL